MPATLPALAVLPLLSEAPFSLNRITRYFPRPVVLRGIDGAGEESKP